MKPNIEQATEYILLKLMENEGSFNLLHLDGRKFKDEPQRFETIDYLLKQNYIVKVQGSFKHVHRITEKGKLFIYCNYFNRVLQYLAVKDDDFKQVSKILKELSIPDKNSDLANAIDRKLRQDNLVIETEEGGVMINENGRNLISEKQFGLAQQNLVTHISNSSVIIQGSNLNQSSFSNFENSSSTQLANEFLNKTDQDKNWWKIILSSNWTITIVGGLIVGLIMAYLVFYFKWNQ